MNVKSLLGGLSFLSMLYACSNDVDALSEQNANDAQEVFEQTIKYGGNTYQVLCKMENDSLIYLDKEFNSLYMNEISRIPDLATFVYKNERGNDIIEYYTSEKELIKQRNISYFNIQEINEKMNSRVLDMPNPDAGRAILYDDTDFKDRTVILDMDCDQYPCVVNLKDYANFNDKTSAIRVFNFLEPGKFYRPSYADVMSSVDGSQLRTCFIGYEDSGFQGKILYCVATYSKTQNLNDPSTASHQDYKLKNIGWNDKISSCIFRIIHVDLINKGEVTPHDPV